MGASHSKIRASKDAAARKGDRAVCCLDYSSSVDGISSPERPLAVQEALFDRRLLSPAKRVTLENGSSWAKHSDNIAVKEDKPCTFHRWPIAQRTDLARGGLAMEHGLHLYKFDWSTKQRGTHAVIGVCTDSTPLSARGYTHLVGATKSSWGWDLSKRGLYHGGKRSRFDYPNQASATLDQVPSVVVMIVDMDRGTLAFEVNSRYQGIAFTGLKGHTLYAAASAVWGNCEVEMKYLGSTYPGEVRPLMTLARNSVRQAMGARRIADGCVEDLSLPPIFKVYINCQLPQQYAVENRCDMDNNIEKEAEAERDVEDSPADATLEEVREDAVPVASGKRRQQQAPEARRPVRPVGSCGSIDSEQEPIQWQPLTMSRVEQKSTVPVFIRDTAAVRPMLESSVFEKSIPKVRSESTPPLDEQPKQHFEFLSKSDSAAGKEAGTILPAYMPTIPCHDSSPCAT